MITEDRTLPAQKKAKCTMIVWGLTYLFLFPFLFFFFAPFVGVNSINTSFSKKLIGFITLLPIFEIPVSFFVMWFSYSRDYYKVVRFCWMIPLLFFALVLLVHVISLSA